jgi:hypothetical protein
MALRFDGRDWPRLTIKSDPGGANPLMEGQFQREAHLLGYGDVLEAVNAICELNVATGQSNGHDISLCIPVFATISGLRVKLQDKSVYANIVHHSAFSNLKALACIRGKTVLAGEPFREHVPISAFTIQKDGEIVQSGSLCRFSELNAEDWVQVRLVHPELGEVKRDENCVRLLIPPAERNILLEALKAFCGDAELDDLLTRAYDIKPPRLKEGAAFEHRVAWLLGMFGLSTIVLGDYEKGLCRH